MCMACGQMCMLLLAVLVAVTVGAPSAACTHVYGGVQFWPESGTLGIVVGVYCFLTEIFVAKRQFSLASFTIAAPIYAILLHFLDSFAWWPDAIGYSLLPGLATTIFVDRLISGDLISPVSGIAGTCLLKFLIGCMWWESIAYGGLIALGMSIMISYCPCTCNCNFLHCLGFDAEGVRHGSFAARWQRPNTQRGSVFSRLQSAGATHGYYIGV